jgi:hypothetical protein
MKLWQHLTHGRQEKIASQTAFSQCQGKDPNVVKRLARATKKEDQIRQITHKVSYHDHHILSTSFFNAPSLS